MKSNGLDIRSDGREDDSRIWSEANCIFDRPASFASRRLVVPSRLPSKIIGRPSSTKFSDLIVERRPEPFRQRPPDDCGGASDIGQNDR